MTAPFDFPGPRHPLRTVLLAATALATASCAAVEGYPSDPEDSTAILASLQPYFDPAKDVAYNNAPSQPQRDSIVLSRMRAYDISFDRFEKQLWSDGNAFALGGDLTALTLGGIATTVKSAATKTIFSAANLGVIGAEAAINRDLYYQRTLPALIAQMEANRAKIKLHILTGLTQDFQKYSLALAEVDLDDLKRAGSLPSAISNITGQANTDNATAQQQLQALRSGNFSLTNTSKQLRAWRTAANGGVDAVKMGALQYWMSNDKIDPNLAQIPPEVLISLDNPEMEAARKRAIAALNIP